MKLAIIAAALLCAAATGATIGLWRSDRAEPVEPLGWGVIAAARRDMQLGTPTEGHWSSCSTGVSCSSLSDGGNWSDHKICNTGVSCSSFSAGVR